MCGKGLARMGVEKDHKTGLCVLLEALNHKSRLVLPAQSASGLASCHGRKAPKPQQFTIWI